MRERAVAIGCAVVQALSIVPGSAGERSPVVLLLASLVGFGSGLLLLRRHTASVQVLALTAVCYVLQVLLRGPVLPVVVSVAALAVAQRSLSDEGSPRRDAVVALLGALVAVGAGPLLVGRPGQAAPYVVLLLVVVLGGGLLALRRIRDAARRREAVHAERLRLARDLHDAVGHGLSAITVQAGAGRMALAAGDDAAAIRALTGVEKAGQAVLREVRWMVSLLRDDDERPGLTEVPRLVEDARRAGLDVELALTGDLTDADADVAEVAYRVVQEAVTNVLRHSGGATAAVRVHVGDGVDVEVVDQGREQVPGFVEGNGLRGMRERVAGVSGAVDAGPVEGGTGWAVRAKLPAAPRDGGRG